MGEGVIVTVALTVKPQHADAFAGNFDWIFPETKLRKGFRSIHLHRSVVDPNQFLLLEEWDNTEAFQAYAQFRTDTGDTAQLLEMTAAPPQIGLWPSKPLVTA